MELSVQAVRIAAANDDHAVLVFANDALVAILSQLSDLHEDAAGRWFLECGFGPAANCDDDFPDVEAACRWIQRRVSMAL